MWLVLRIACRTVMARLQFISIGFKAWQGFSPFMIADLRLQIELCIPDVRTQQHPGFDDLKASIVNRQSSFVNLKSYR